MTDQASEKEFQRRQRKYRRKGLSIGEAAKRAMDDMFAERIGETGGRRIPGSTSTTLGDATFLKVPVNIRLGESNVRAGFYNARIDDKSYNCHSYTFHGAKVTRLGKLKGLGKKIPSGVVKGKTYYDALELIKNGIHLDTAFTTLVILPRWIANPTEVKQLMQPFRKRKGGERFDSTAIAMYKGTGEYPHSGKVTKVDKHGNPTRVKGKFGHYSLFEHDPVVVPAHYGAPEFYRRK
jgi:hypothetical protein